MKLSFTSILTVMQSAQTQQECYLSKKNRQMIQLTEQGLTSHQTHYRSYRGRIFTGHMTQPTVLKHWRKIGF